MEKLDFAKHGSNICIALTNIHQHEEPCISGTKGSGTIFFSHCNLRCCYCQNYEISAQGLGKEITVEKLAEIFLQQQEKKVHNINLVTPTIYVPSIIKAIQIARKHGLDIPIIYNSSGYETIQTIEMLKGYVDIYMPDLKYAQNELAIQYSNANQYFKYATSAIKAMYKQVGKPLFNPQGILQRGVLIRHLILPNHIKNTMEVLKWIKENLEENVLISVMAQYFPTYNAKNIPDLNRKLTKREYKKVEEYLYELGLKNGYIQEIGEQEEKYVPNFKYT